MIKTPGVSAPVSPRNRANGASVNPCSPTDHRGEADPDRQLHHRLFGGEAGVPCRYHRKRQHGGKRTDGIVHNRLPLQQGHGAFGQASGAQQGGNNRRTRHDHDAAKVCGTFPAQPRAIAQRQ